MNEEEPRMNANEHGLEESELVCIGVYPWFLFTVHKPVRMELGDSWWVGVWVNNGGWQCRGLGYGKYRFLAIEMSQDKLVPLVEQ